MSLAFPVEPMKAGIGTLPVDDDKWAYEVKFDGYRTLAFIEGGRIRLQSSSGLDATATYPEIAGLAVSVNAAAAILDGELVVLDAAGRPRFELLQRHESQAAFYVFDVLAIEGVETISLPYEQRRQLLASLVEPGRNWMVPAHRVGDGAALLAATAEQGLEGVMAKRLGSTYQPGKRSPNWRKVKNRQRIELIVGGYSTGTGNRSGTFGALLVGQLDGGALRFAGGVGTGFSQRVLEQLHRQLRSLRTEICPFDPPPPRPARADATWVSPEIRITVEYAEFTNDGLVRHASYIGSA